ncbi:MAG: PDZ domain-containing protein [Bacilli bacterium]|nr:PDZ domain-containing protein [Bacilli bacterium]
MLNFFKKYYKYILIYIVILIILTIEFPYYIDAPGGIVDINNRIKIEDSYKSEGTLNLAYVTEYKATAVTLLISLFNSDYKVMSKKDSIPKNIKEDDSEFRDRIMLEESYSNAIYIGYTKAGKEVNVKSEKIYVNAIFEEANTDLEIGDQILAINGIEVKKKEEIDTIFKEYQVGDDIEITVLKNKKEVKRTAKLINYQDKPIIGIALSLIKDMETVPHIDVNYKARESGSSGGLMLSLAIYNQLTEEDITKGRTIVGTGTIDCDGNVGSIGGVEYKLKSAVKSKADIFIVPNGENYDAAVALKKKKGYKIKIVGVSTFDEALDYLKK